MSVTSFQLADKDRYLGQIDKIVHSHSLRKAESLCKLLLYLADHAITQPGVSLKEYQIATEVFEDRILLTRKRMRQSACRLVVYV